MKFSKLSEYLEKLEEESSRNKITQILATLFRATSEKEVGKVTYLLLGRLVPQYEDLVFNVAEKMMVKAIARAYKVSEKEVGKKYKEKGDLGDTAESFSKDKGKGLSVSVVYEKLEKVAKDEGEGSVERKIVGIANLLQALDPLSARFVARIPVGKLRLGFSDKTILDALSYMEKKDKSATSELKRAYEVNPDVGDLALEVKKKGVKEASSQVKPKVGTPILPMLAQRLRSPKKMIEKMGEVSIESKLDGLRIQIHYEKGKSIKAYTRNLNETSWMFPELKKISKFVKASKIILDTEAVGLDSKRKKIANFQTTMTRRRKHEVGETSTKTPIQFFVFDILLSGKKSLMGNTYLERRKELEKVVVDGELFNVLDYTRTKDPKVIESLEKEKQEEGLEGIMIKKVTSKYVPGRTGWRWVKMKEAVGKAAKLSDTLDLVVMGYTRGKGKRASFGVGQFLVGIRDRGQVKTVTKIGTGLTDAQFRELKKRLTKLQTAQKPKEYSVPKDLEPDYWVDPKLVVEIAADEITKSPKHTAGYALRFPRLIKFRDDKSPAQATSLSELKALFKLQK